jgi:hypothetical protein
MEKTPLMRTRVAIGVAALAGSIGLYAALPASATHVDPVEVEGNAPCPAGLTELKVDPVTAGEHSDGTLDVTITLHDTEDGQTFDWTSNIGVDVVIVKGGPNSNVYTYDPESMGDSGLHAPENPSGDWAGLSHISFCYDADTTTTTKPTTTTMPTVTTVPDTTVTTVTTPPTPTAPVAVPVPAQPTFTG